MEVFVEQMNNAGPFVDGSFRDEFDEARRRLITSKTVAERIDAVKTLREFKGELTTAHLVGALFDEDVHVRQAAADALNQIGDADISTECLEVMFQTTPVVDESLAGVVNESAAQTGRDEIARAEILFGIDSKLDDPSREVRSAAVGALGDLDSNEMADALERMLESTSPDRRRRISEALQDSGLVNEVIADLEDCDPRRAQASLSFLLMIARHQIVQPFVHAIEHHDSPVIRRALIKVLTLSGHGHLAESAARRRLGISRQTSDISAYL